MGDAVPYEALLTLLAREARAFVGRRVGFADWIEDVVQDVLLTVHRALATYDPQQPAIVHRFEQVSGRAR